MISRCLLHNRFIPITGCTRCEDLQYLIKTISNVTNWIRNPGMTTSEYVIATLERAVASISP